MALNSERDDVEGNFTTRTSESESYNADQVNNVRYVETESELSSAIGQHQRIELNSDISLSSRTQQDIGSTDLYLDLDGHTILRSDDTDDGLLDITTTGNVVLEDGLIDGNRDGQTDKDGRPEIKIWDAKTFRTSNIRVIDNTGFSFYAKQVSKVVHESPEVDSFVDAPTTSGAGLDGIHAEDPDVVNVTSPDIYSGDDCVSVRAINGDVSRVAVDGGSVKSERANGVRLEIDTNAPSSTTFESANLDTTVVKAGAHGYIAEDDSGSGSIADLSLGGIIKDASANAVNLNTTVEDVSSEITAVTPSGVGIKAVDVQGGKFSGVVSGAGTRGADIGGSGVTMSLTVRGQSTTSSGLWLEDADDVTVLGTIQNCTGAGVRGAGNSEYVTVKATISNCGDFPVKSGGTCDDWTVVGSTGHNNAATGTALNGANNVTANNNWG